MAAGHSHGDDDLPLTEEESEQRRKALRALVVILVPLAVWTLAALIWLWPRDVADHIQNDGLNLAVPGATQEKATITEVEPMDCEGLIGSVPGQNSVCATVVAVLDTGPEQGQSQTFQVTPPIYDSGVEPGQRVVMWRIPIEQMPAAYQFIDFERSTPLWLLAGAFALLVVVVARRRGFLSLLGLGFAFWILIEFMLPALIMGRDPLLVGLVGSAAIMFVVLYTAHGFTLRTTTALVGTLFGLLIIAGLGWWVAKAAHLTGVSSDEDYSLAATTPDMGLTSVVICAIIVAGLGVLNDVTITQASAVWELARTEHDKRRLYTSAMRIGRDHIASTVYTIAFAAAGAALPVLLLLTVYQRPIGQVIATEMFSAEIIRTLVGSIGLILAVPVTTAVGVAAAGIGRIQRVRTVDVAPAAVRARPASRPSHDSPTEVEVEHDSDTPAATSSANEPDDAQFRRPRHLDSTDG
ncbi:YibE/F family protein [Aestuariimicrobium ganziense]|uniref:YibE/F family protein n=1 Tax=Aestuariimicrobium ganziense TaxID=2773677 RepID=UPI001945B74A|nr:YibE/F family protein [Aestuariimicrobium ganziense]